MSATAVARRYAEALADISIAHGITAQVEQELKAFVELMAIGGEVYNFFANPIVSQKDKLKVLNAIIDQAHPSQIMANLLRLLLSHYRLRHLPAIYEQFRRQINEREGIVTAEVTTAVQLSTAEQEALRNKLQQMTGKRVELQFKVDPALIGGAVTRIGSIIYDGSMRAGLEAIKERLKAGGEQSQML
jgi:F-type H+-transporting ATPase subunit delta